MKAGPVDGEYWSSGMDFPALIWCRDEHENNRLGWWLYWTDTDGEPQHALMSGDEHDQAGATAKAREWLEVARPDS